VRKCAQFPRAPDTILDENVRRRSLVSRLQSHARMQRTLVVSSRREVEIVGAHDELVVATPAEAIKRLERRPRIHTIVLAGVYARDEALAGFLGVFYPLARIERRR
jgi:hypothetical protein